MPTKSLPAHLQQVLENHVAQSDIAHDEELEAIFQRLRKLNDSVEKIKQTIKMRRTQVTESGHR
ncbi:hypothetical protein P2G88_02580 [Aliiglaciecola sp. CAU 1673]|uniref:hypothetical protein n=1 Tax=Aliiglaciecola sp. CAU 1673 TaxID=3032595 RepID=UPI0023D9D937|nr:hypothetical protein [Aliiglaciecola sp. CAU 1673]MDF2177129.1 hypothetical protein [Aliiglaciecola sp. CAU 1673]